jgi:hypothetical protein
MIEKIKITDADVVEQIRNSLPEATDENKGLLSSDNKIMGGLFLNAASMSTIHPNDYYLYAREGIIMGITTYSMPNWTLGAGCIIHCQRDRIGSVTTSQMILQLFFGSNLIRYRYGIGNSSEIIWEPWKDL